MRFLLKMGASVSVLACTALQASEATRMDDHYVIRKQEDLEQFGGPALISIYNAVVKSHPEYQMREVNKFSTRAVALTRVWGQFVTMDADEREKEKEAAKKTAPAPKSATAPAPKPTTAPVRSVSVKDLPPPPAGSMHLKDKEVKAAKKIYPLKGVVQVKCHELLSQKGGIPIDQFIVEMNALGKGKWTRGNTWSSLVFTLATYKGYGLTCKGEVLSISGEPNA